MKVVIISGSARKDGDTSKIVDILTSCLDSFHVDLNDYKISYYDYEHQNRCDDFIPLMRQLVDEYDVFLLVTPVYWYSMSAIMKTFIDRFTDLITIEKELGRRLREKSMLVLSSSNGSNLGDNFWLPFSESANYLGISYLGNLHIIIDEHTEEHIRKFLESIKF